MTEPMLLKSSHKRVQKYDDQMTPTTQPTLKRARFDEDDQNFHDDHQDNYHDVHHEGPPASTSQPLVSSSSISLTEVSI